MTPNVLPVSNSLLCTKYIDILYFCEKVIDILYVYLCIKKTKIITLLMLLTKGKYGKKYI